MPPEEFVEYPERWKYEKAYRELSSYAMGPKRKNQMLKDLTEAAQVLSGCKYLDVGCGRGETLDKARQLGFDAWGTELVPQLCNDRVISASGTALPFGSNTFGLVTCYDVLEHLVPGDEQIVLDELGRVCGHTLILTTNNKPSHLPDGTDLHINKRERSEWDADIVARWGAANVFYHEFYPREWHWKIRVE